MLRKLKKMISGSVTDDLIAQYTPEIKHKLQEVLSGVEANVVNDDGSYLQKVVPPVRLAVESAASGATKLIPSFDQRFDLAMLHLRDELIVSHENNLSLVDDFDEHLPDVLKSGFEKAKEAV
jgi:hypothetical protein